MKRKYIGVGLMAALVFSAAPLSGTAAGETATGDWQPPEAEATAVATAEGEATVAPKPVNKQKCIEVKDTGKGSLTLQARGVNKTVGLTAGDGVVVCLTVLADASANATLDLQAAVNAADEGVTCTDELGTATGAGFNLVISANVVVDDGFNADATLFAEVSASAGKKKIETDPVTYPKDGSENATNDERESPPTVLGGTLEYCKAVAV